MSEVIEQYETEEAVSFETSWTQAERAVFDHLMYATGTVENKSAFLGVNPGIVNAWFLQSEATPELAVPVFSTPDPRVMAIQCEARATFLARDACQRWGMAIAKKLPICTGLGNVNAIKIRGMSSVDHEWVSVPNEGTQFPTWNISIYFDVVFKTGSKKDA